MKNRRNLFATILLGVLLMTLTAPLTAVSASTEEQQTQPPILGPWRADGNWYYIQNDIITIVFPAGSKKPMFLWWYTKDPNNINVVKYKGLIEYASFERPYFMLKSQADGMGIRNMMQNLFYEPRRQMMQDHPRLTGALALLSIIGNFSGLHRPFLPFSGATWELSPIVEVPKDNPQYLSFNFTLVSVPDYWTNLQFAQGNIIIRCRFYYTPATVDVEGKYSYTVQAGELKMDLIVKHWEWNIDKIKGLLHQLGDQLGIIIPEGKAGLALWVNLASINMTKLQLGTVEEDAEDMSDVGLERASMAGNMYVEGEKISVSQNMTAQDAQSMPNRMRERFKFRFEKGNATLAGFFKFVPTALLRNPVNGSVMDDVDVTASYIAAGGHMRLYISYPYFGDYELEHDPSLGLETLPTLVTYQLLIALLGIATIIAVTVLLIRWKKGPVNILKPN